MGVRTLKASVGVWKFVVSEGQGEGKAPLPKQMATQPRLHMHQKEHLRTCDAIRLSSSGDMPPTASPGPSTPGIASSSAASSPAAAAAGAAAPSAVASVAPLSRSRALQQGGYRE